jgi:hypothetical protein
MTLLGNSSTVTDENMDCHPFFKSSSCGALFPNGHRRHRVSFCVEELKDLLAGMDVAGNIQRGDNMNEMHIETMQQRDSINRYNVLSAHFSEFGYGLAMGKDGKVHCCQLFRS